MRCAALTVILILFSFHNSPLKAKRFILFGAAAETFFTHISPIRVIIFLESRRETEKTHTQTFKWANELRKQ